jgi:hypothetical protein
VNKTQAVGQPSWEEPGEQSRIELVDSRDEPSHESRAEMSRDRQVKREREAITYETVAKREREKPIPMISC